MSIKAKMELLAPAGSFEALKAAVANGADAVYFGGGRFNARKNAENFEGETLASAIDYVRERGVKAYITLNTLLKDTELEEALELASFIWKEGAHGVIVQDMGLLKRIREALPDLNLHASTQMTVMDRSGVDALGSLGVKRVVLARELSLEAVSAIGRNNPVELEVFVHGALCVCYSGQCLLSSAIGARSGNRGLCAQPCRLPWRVGNAKGELLPPAYRLSPRDMMGLDHLPGLRAAGVTSLKIEGRMKSPEYVAAVTGVYRKYLNLLEEKGEAGYRIYPDDRERLLQIFNRGGFTASYLEGSRDWSRLIYPRHPKNRGVPLGTVEAVREDEAYGETLKIKLEKALNRGDGIEVELPGGEQGVASALITSILINGGHVAQAPAGASPWVGAVRTPCPVGAKVWRTSSVKLLESLRETYERGEKRRIPVKMDFTMAVNKPAILTIRDDDGHRVQAQSAQIAEKAQVRPLSEKRVEEQLKKTQDTPYEAAGVSISLDGDSTLPVSAINALRREALELLKAARLAKARLPVPTFTKARQAGGYGVNTVEQPQLSLFYEFYPRIPAALPENVGRVYVPVSTLDQMKALNEVFSGEIFIHTPPVLSAEGLERLTNQILEQEGLLTGISSSNIGTLSYLRKRFPNLKHHGERGLHAMNAQAAAFLKDMGAQSLTLSPELNSGEVAAFQKKLLPLEGEVYGRLPLMTMASCPAGADKACSGKCGVCSKREGILEDRKGARFIYTRSGEPAVTRLYNHLPVLMDDGHLLRTLGLRWLRLLFTLEEPEMEGALIRYYSALLKDEEKSLNDRDKDLIRELKASGITKLHWFRGV